MKTPQLVLISHHLCPYVQRVAIALDEKGMAFERIDIDLSNKPDWFLAISPLGKTPVLKVGKRAIFESAVILEYLEDVFAPPLHPAAPLDRAEHRAWIAFGSGMLDEIAGLYNAPDAGQFEARRARLAARIATLEAHVAGPWFAGTAVSLVDVAFAPVFRYFDVIERIVPLDLFVGSPRVAAWRNALADRAGMRRAVPFDYPQRLEAFIAARGSYLARLLAAPYAPAITPVSRNPAMAASS